ncbi:hypothetical protein ACFL30_00965 [Candidatus Latescibacterota bacterium]
MIPDNKSLHVISGKRRLEELREKRTRQDAEDSINKSRSMVLTNFVIELVSCALVFVGVFYLIRFFIMKRSDVDPVIFKLSAGCLTVFIVGWLLYSIAKIRRYVLLLSMDNNEKQKTGV